MTKLLDQAVEALRQRPPAEQDRVAEVVMNLLDHGASEPEHVDPDELRDALEALAEVERGEIATPEEVAAMWRSFER